MQYDRIRYNLKKPTGRRKSFAIVQDTLRANGTRTQATLRHETVIALNKLMAEGVKSEAEVEVELRQLIDRFHDENKKRFGVVSFHEDNLKLLDEYWRRRYEFRTTKDKYSAKCRLKRAIEAVGMLSLTSADSSALQRAVNRARKGNRQRDTVAALNQMLAFAGRSIRLSMARKERRKVKYITPEDFKKVLPQVPENFRTLFITLIATGCRVGEAFALERSDLKGDVLYVETQLDRDELERETKNGRTRHTIVMAEFLDTVKKWVSTPIEKRAEIRRYPHAKIMTAACEAIFPDEPEKHLCAHDLRHSYAIWLLTKGVNLTLVAQALGNSVAVCQEYYAGFELTPDSIQAVKSILKQ